MEASKLWVSCWSLEPMSMVSDSCDFSYFWLCCLMVAVNYCWQMSHVVWFVSWFWVSQVKRLSHWRPSWFFYLAGRISRTLMSFSGVFSLVTDFDVLPQVTWSSPKTLQYFWFWPKCPRWLHVMTVTVLFLGCELSLLVSVSLLRGFILHPDVAFVTSWLGFSPIPFNSP